MKLLQSSVICMDLEIAVLRLIIICLVYFQDGMAVVCGSRSHLEKESIAEVSKFHIVLTNLIIRQL